MTALILKNNSFFYTCKENYFLGIVPADPQSKEKDGYKRIVSIASTYFSAGLYDPIIQYLNESRYMMQVWSAYLTLEYGEPNDILKGNCVKIIESAIEKPSAELSEQQESFFRTYLQTKAGSHVI